MKKPLANDRQKYTQFSFRDANSKSAGPAPLKSSGNLLSQRSSGMKIKQKLFGDSNQSSGSGHPDPPKNQNNEFIDKLEVSRNKASSSCCLKQAASEGKVSATSQFETSKIKFPIVSLFTIYGANLGKSRQQNLARISFQPEILTAISKASATEAAELNLKQLKKEFPYLGAIQAISNLDKKLICSMIDTSRHDLQSMLGTVKNKKPKISTHVSTNLQGDRIYVVSMAYQKYFCESQHLFSISESMQVSSALEKPIYDTLTSILNFIFATVVRSHNEKAVLNHYGEQQPCQSVEQMLLARVEFIPTVFIQHFYFQYNVVERLRFQFSKGPLDELELSLQNFYMHDFKFKAENFKFPLLLKHLGSIDRLLLLVKNLLIEKKVIFIQESLSELPLVIQALLSLIEPFRWPYPLIPSLPAEMVEVLDSPLPFIIGINKKLWELQCKVQMMDNVKEQNFVIIDLDTQETRGLNDIYDVDSRVELPSSFTNEIKDSVFKLESLKDSSDNFFSNRTDDDSRKQGEPEDGTDLYWAWFELRLKQEFCIQFLKLLGHFERFFYSEEHISTQAQKRKGRDNLSCGDVFDMKKYLQSVSPDSDRKEFLIQFCEKQAFSVFIEEVFKLRDKGSRDGQKTQIELFVEQLSFCSRHGDNTSVEVSPRALKDLRRKQNQHIEKVYVTFKSSVPFKFQFILDEYVRQICLKNNLGDDSKAQNKEELRERCRDLLVRLHSDSFQARFELMTLMKGIDYGKIQQYHNKLQEKKQSMTMRKMLQSQDSRLKGLGNSSNQEVVSDGGLSDMKFGRFNNQITSINSSVVQRKLFSRQGSLPIAWNEKNFGGGQRTSSENQSEQYSALLNNLSTTNQSIQGRLATGSNFGGRVDPQILTNQSNTLESTKSRFQTIAAGAGKPPDILTPVGIKSGKSYRSPTRDVQNLTKYLNSNLVSQPVSSSEKPRKKRSERQQRKKEVPEQSSPSKVVNTSSFQAMRQNFLNGSGAPELQQFKYSVFDKRKATIQASSTSRQFSGWPQTSLASNSKPPAIPHAGQLGPRTGSRLNHTPNANQKNLPHSKSFLGSNEKKEPKKIRNSKTTIIQINLKEEGFEKQIQQNYYRVSEADPEPKNKPDQLEDMNVPDEEEDGISQKSRHSCYSNQPIVAASCKAMREDPSPLKKELLKSRNDTNVHSNKKSDIDHNLYVIESMQVSSQIDSELSSSRPSGRKKESPERQQVFLTAQSNQNSQQQLSGDPTTNRKLMSPGEDFTYQTAQSDSLNEHNLINEIRFGTSSQKSSRKPSTRYDEAHKRESTLVEIPDTNQDPSTCPQSSRVIEMVQNQKPATKLELKIPSKQRERPPPLEKASFPAVFHKFCSPARIQGSADPTPNSSSLKQQQQSLQENRRYFQPSGGDSQVMDMSGSIPVAKEIKSDEENIPDTSRDCIHFKDEKVINGDYKGEAKLLFSKSHNNVHKKSPIPPKIRGKNENGLDFKKMGSPMMLKQISNSGGLVSSSSGKPVKKVLISETIKSPDVLKKMSEGKTVSDNARFKQFQLADNASGTKPSFQLIETEALREQQAQIGAYQEAQKILQKKNSPNGSRSRQSPLEPVPSSSDFAESSMIPSEQALDSNKFKHLQPNHQPTLKLKSPIQENPIVFKQKTQKKTIDPRLMSPNSHQSGVTTVKKQLNLQICSLNKHASPTMIKNFSSGSKDVTSIRRNLSQHKALPNLKQSSSLRLRPESSSQKKSPSSANKPSIPLRQDPKAKLKIPNSRAKCENKAKKPILSPVDNKQQTESLIISEQSTDQQVKQVHRVKASANQKIGREKYHGITARMNQQAQKGLEMMPQLGIQSIKKQPSKNEEDISFSQSQMSLNLPSTSGTQARPSQMIPQVHNLTKKTSPMHQADITTLKQQPYQLPQIENYLSQPIQQPLQADEPPCDMSLSKSGNHHKKKSIFSEQNN